MIELKKIPVKKADAQIIISLPSMMATLWKLEEGDELLMELTEDTKTVTIHKMTKEERDELVRPVSSEDRSDS